MFVFLRSFLFTGSQPKILQRFLKCIPMLLGNNKTFGLVGPTSFSQTNFVKNAEPLFFLIVVGQID